MAGPVPTGSLLECTQGAAPTPLIVVPVDVVLGDAPLATIMDFAPMKNVVPFGTCKILTAAASGVSTPCVPATAAPWAPGAKVVKIGQFPALTDGCSLVCSIGGKISVKESMQKSVDISIE